MPPKNLLQKIAGLLDSRNKEQMKRHRISDLLKQLKKEEKAAKAKLAKLKGRTERKRLALEIKILHTQRKKALQRYKELKKQDN
jgi:hypothetical protein